MVHGQATSVAMPGQALKTVRWPRGRERGLRSIPPSVRRNAPWMIGGKLCGARALYSRTLG